jgi:hypothetical protein
VQPSATRNRLFLVDSRPANARRNTSVMLFERRAAAMTHRARAKARSERAFGE